MSAGMSLARAVMLGIAGAIVAPEGWRTFLVTALLIIAALLTDWIAEEFARAEARKVRTSVADVLRKIGSLR